MPWPPRACTESVLAGTLTAAAADEDCCTPCSGDGS